MQVFATDAAIYELNKTLSSKEDRVFARRQDTSTCEAVHSLPQTIASSKELVGYVT